MSASPKQIVGWWGKTRRDPQTAAMIRRALKAEGLITRPDFAAASYETPVRLLPADAGTDSLPFGRSSTEEPEEEATLGHEPNPALRVRQIPAADRDFDRVKATDPLTLAITLMMAHNRRCLPVMRNERTIDGVIGWASLGRARHLGCDSDEVGLFMVPHAEVAIDAPVLEAADKLQNNEILLVRAEQNRLTGVLTPADLADWHRRLTRPFLLVGEIEESLRRLLGGRVTHSDLTSAGLNASGELEGLAGLSFGDYVRLFEKQDVFDRLGFPFDRVEAIRLLHRVREIRNSVMHFHPDPLAPGDLRLLHTVRGWLTEAGSRRAA